MSALWIWMSGLAFAVLHSVFAMQRCKHLFYRLGLNARTYRLIYSTTALMLTVLWLGLAHVLPDTPLYHIRGWENGLMVALQLVGLGIVVLSLRAIDTPAFLGFSMSEEQDAFVERGIYHYVRHPMYSGVMLALLASPVQTANSLNLFVIVTAYFIIGSGFEERRMLAIYPDYADYRRHVPAFIPNLVKKSNP